MFVRLLANLYSSLHHGDFKQSVAVVDITNAPNVVQYAALSFVTWCLPDLVLLDAGYKDGLLQQLIAIYQAVDIPSRLGAPAIATRYINSLCLNNLYNQKYKKRATCNISVAMTSGYEFRSAAWTVSPGLGIPSELFQMSLLPPRGRPRSHLRIPGGEHRPTQYRGVSIKYADMC